jgi:alpha-glucosidase
LEYQYPRLGFANCDDEYMFGGEWLVAPVVKSGAPRMVRLPRGSWREYRSGRVFRGPRVIEFDTSDGGVPIFQRVN